MRPIKKRLSSEIADLNAVINAAACDPELWGDVATALGHFIPGSKILFQVVGKDNKTVHQVVHAGFTEKTIKAYGEYFWKVNPWTSDMNGMAMSSFRTSSELYPDRQFRNTEFFTDLVDPERESDGATALKFAAHRDRYAYLCIHYDFRYRHEMHSRFVELMQPLVPGLGTALELNRLISPQLDRSAGHGLVKQLVDAAMVVDQDCRLLASNSTANQLLAGEELIVIRAQDIVEIKNRDANAVFSKLVQETCGSLLDNTGNSDLIINTRSSGYILTCAPMAIDQTGALPAGLLSIFAPRTVSLVLIRRRIKEDTSLIIEELRQRFRLTKAEVGLVLEFDRGGTLSEIADRVGVTRSTVQTHLRSIFAKTGTSKQRDVVTLVKRDAASARQFSVDD